LFARHSRAEKSFIHLLEREGSMRHLTLAAAGILLLAVSGHAGAGVIAPAGLSQRGDLSSIEFVQDKRVQEKRKSDTITQRVKRAWKDLVGYKFNVACPALIPLSHTTCTETGKNRADARAKCVSRNPFCYITDASR
jgi:hypothetical protein